MTDKIVVLCACESEQQAESIARHLIDRRLAACVNIVGSSRSIYRWKEKVEDSREFLLLIKSRRDLFDHLRAAIESLHSYEVPEVIALTVVDGSPSYLGWLDLELKKDA